MPLFYLLLLLLLGTISNWFHLVIWVFGHFYFLVESALVCVLRVLHLGMDLAKLLLHLILMLFFEIILVIQDWLSLELIIFLFIPDVVFTFGVDELHLSISSLSLLILLIPQLCELSLLFEPFHFQRLCMFFSSLFDHIQTFLPIPLSLFQVLLALLVPLRSVDQLLLETLFFVLLDDELLRELFVSVLHLSDLPLIKLGQHDRLVRLRLERPTDLRCPAAPNSSILEMIATEATNFLLALFCRGTLGEHLTRLEPLCQQLLTAHLLTNWVGRELWDSVLAGDELRPLVVEVSHLFMHDVPPLLQHIVEDLLERGQVIVVTNGRQLSNQDRVLIFLGTLVSNLHFEIRHLFPFDIWRVDRKSLAGFAEFGRVKVKLHPLNHPCISDGLQEVIDTGLVISILVADWVDLIVERVNTKLHQFTIRIPATQMIGFIIRLGGQLLSHPHQGHVRSWILVSVCGRSDLWKHLLWLIPSEAWLLGNELVLSSGRLRAPGLHGVWTARPGEHT